MARIFKDKDGRIVLEGFRLDTESMGGPLFVEGVNVTFVLCEIDESFVADDQICLLKTPAQEKEVLHADRMGKIGRIIELERKALLPYMRRHV